MTEAPAIHAIDALPVIGPAAICMGVFDGVHRGHVALAAATVRAAKRRGVRSVALVFEPHPDEIVRPGTVVPRLAPIAENLRRLALAGIDRPIVVRFDPELRARAPEEFLGAMASAIELRALVMTPESAFGRNRAGTPDAMRALGARTGFDLLVADDVVRDAGEPISSARVRAALAAGDLGTAVRLLGHPLFLEAEVGASDGDRRHLSFDYPAALPAAGAYPALVAGSGDGGAGTGARAIVRVDANGSATLEGAGGPQAGRVAIELDGAG